MELSPPPDLSGAVLGRLAEDFPGAGWLTMLGAFPDPTLLRQLVQLLQPEVPLLLIEPQASRAEALLEQAEAEGWQGLQVCSDLVAAEAGEACWYHYNDPRRDGLIPPEELQSLYPNVRLERLELRPTRPLAAVLDDWLAGDGPGAAHARPSDGALVLPAARAEEVLAGAGPWLEHLTSVLLLGPAADRQGDGWSPLLEQVCLAPVAAGPNGQLWRRDRQRLLERQLTALTATCDRLRQERDQLQARLQAVDAEVEAILSQLEPSVDQPATGGQSQAAASA